MQIKAFIVTALLAASALGAVVSSSGEAELDDPALYDIDPEPVTFNGITLCKVLSASA
jgi:hypothetical protein